MSLFTDYFSELLKYQEKYGEHTIVLYQVGSFYNAYEYNPELCSTDTEKVDVTGKMWTEKMGDIKESSELCECMITKPLGDSKPYGIRNPNLFGFPCTSIEGNIKRLLTGDYVVVVMDQVAGYHKKKNGDRIPHHVTEICSATMNFNRLSNSVVHAHIVTLYIEFQKSNNINLHDGYLIVSGAASLDIVTGVTTVNEFYSKDNNEFYCNQELYRWLTAMHPKEVVVHLMDHSQNLAYHPYAKYLEKILELKRYDRYVIHHNKVDKEYYKIPYQTDFFNKLFPTLTEVGNVVKHQDARIIETLGLAIPKYGRLALILLTQYCYEQNGPVDMVKAPRVSYFDEDEILILTHNAALCLEIIPQTVYFNKRSREIDSLLSVMDRTSTLLGRRCLEYLLLHPMQCPTDIERHYKLVDDFIHLRVGVDGHPLWLYIENEFRGLPDVAKLQRKCELKVVQPKEFGVLLHSYQHLIDVLINLKDVQSLPTSFNVLNFKVLLDQWLSNIDMTALSSVVVEHLASGETCYDFACNPFKSLDIQALTEVEGQLATIESYLNQSGIEVRLETKCINKKGVKVKHQTKFECKQTLLLCNNANAKKLNVTNIDEHVCGKLHIDVYNTTTKSLTSSMIQQLLVNKDKLRRDIGIKMSEMFDLFIIQFLHHRSYFTPICQTIGLIDVIHNYAKIAVKNKYFRPTLVTSGTSFIDIRDMRHPIVEKIIDGEYIVNDFSVGKNTDLDTTPYGFLLYSTNMAGKTSALKGVSLAIIMAQAGSYVPGHLRYHPYTKLITRLSTHDNIFKSESSFEVEMTELRTIIKEGNESTLVIADEIGSRTENWSASVITISSIQHLLDQKVTFMISSHIHDIIHTPWIKNLDPSLFRIYHLQVTLDPQTELLVYNRKLQDGPCQARYGLSVIKYLKFPQAFMDQCYKIALELDHLDQHYLSTKTSRYNGMVYMDGCALCGTSEMLQTHHIKEAHLADDEGYIGYMYKNKKDNLLVLCQDCHQRRVHQLKRELEVLQTCGGHIVAFKND